MINPYTVKSAYVFYHVSPDKLTKTAEANNPYTVQPGDTLSGIGQRKGFSVEDISQWNNISNPNRIQVGQELRFNPTQHPTQRPTTNQQAPQTPWPQNMYAPGYTSKDIKNFPLEDYVNYLWYAENAQKTGFNPGDNTWSYYKDPVRNRDGSIKRMQYAIGPGIMVPKGTHMTQEELNKHLYSKTIPNHLIRARGLHNTMNSLPPEKQKILMDYVWTTGSDAPNFYAAARRGDVEGMKDEIGLVNNSRRTNLMHDLFRIYRQHYGRPY